MNSSPIEGVGLWSKDINQSEAGMQIENRRPVSLTENQCLRPESLRNSHQINKHSKISNQNSNVMNLPPDTNQTRTNTDLNSTLTQIDSQTLLKSTAEQADFLTFVETFPFNSLNIRRPSPRPPMRSRQLGRNSRLDQRRQRNRTRERAAKTRFVAARTTSRKDGTTQLLEAMRWCHLIKSGKANTATRIGVLAVNGSKPLLSNSKKEVVGLPGLFDADLLAEFTEKDRFLGPMKRAIINKEIT